MDEPADQKIHLMDDVLASQVAAGEVVERPASVLKELVENSIDAGAKCVRVEVRRGGVAMLKVTDDGCGMSRTDAMMCLMRHATSKLRSLEDLFDIRQLGFRGEALPSIASVSQLQIQTRRQMDVEGTLLRCDGAGEPEVMNAGCAPGTEVCVSNLFFNTPVRRKFLKSEDTEFGHVEHQLRLHALAFPEVRFVLVKDGNCCFDLPATHDMRQRIAGFIGREQSAKLMRIRPTEAPGIRVTGFLMPLTEARRNRRMQYIFLNGRPIEDKIIARAIRDGYGGFPTGLHPALFLYIEMEPSLVDVNVHPAKREVRFRRPSDVTLAVLEAIGATLAAHARGEQETAVGEASPAVSAVPNTKVNGQTENEAPAMVGASTPVPVAEVGTSPDAAPKEVAQPIAPLRPATEQPPHLVLKPLVQPRQSRLKLEDAPPASAVVAPPHPTYQEHREGEEARFDEALPKFRYIGCLQERYALFENSEGLVMMNPRAARERIIFERLLESHKRPLTSQGLLEPVMLEMDTRDMGLARELLPKMEQSGFIVTPFGRNTLRVEAIPALLPLDDVEAFMYELLEYFIRGEGRLRRSRNPFEPFAVRLASQYAVQEDMITWLRHPMPLLVDLLRCEIPYCTPSGKPTLVPFSMSEVNRKFQAL